MYFSSVTFLCGFLPALLALYFLVPKRCRRARNGILLAFSLAFYGFAGAKFLLLMLASVAINYCCGLLAAGNRPGIRRAAVWLACILGLGLLVYFKYAGFLVAAINACGAALPVPHITLPIGISFFTFQGLSYVVDVARGDAAVQRNPLRVALYIALFPQLVAGPIVRYATVAGEIVRRDESLSAFAGGATRFMFGFAKKMLLANAAGEVADGIFAVGAAELSCSLAWLGALAYTAQIYFDFSAYSDMAIGLGRIFGFHFLENFNYPYIARSVTDFWRRWHISLSSWFRDYVYIPLGGNRCGPARQLLNLLIVWLLTGLWHGAAWNFVLWGLWFFLWLAAEKFLFGARLEKLPAVGHIYAQLIVVLSWVLFRAATPAEAWVFFRAMFGFGAAGAGSARTVYYLREYWPELLCCVLCALPLPAAAARAAARWTGRAGTAARELLPRVLALGLFALAYIKLASGSFNPFIYFRF